jgi:hypothetical protein
MRRHEDIELGPERNFKKNTYKMKAYPVDQCGRTKTLLNGYVESGLDD